jgi:transposase, IS30 family
MSRHQLTHINRIELAILLRQGLSGRQIAQALGVHHSTIYRELARNRATNPSGYHVGQAQRRAQFQRHQANQQFRKLPTSQRLVGPIVRKLQAIWSPEQIAGWLKASKYAVRVCAQTIYDWIYRFRPDLRVYLHCRKGRYRRTRAAKLRREGRNKALDLRRIDRRPVHVQSRQRYGHWEGDTVVGAGQSGSIATFVERKSGYLLAYKLERATAAGFAAAATTGFAGVPAQYRRTLTLDNGTEMADYEHIEEQTDLRVYFAYPYHSWERGTNENTNGLLRYFFPKKTSFAGVTQADVDRAVRLINTRPRKRLGYRTPEQMLKRRCRDLG